MNPFVSQTGPVIPGGFSGAVTKPFQSGMNFAWGAQPIQQQPMQNIMGQGPQRAGHGERPRFDGLRRALMQQKQRNQFGGPGTSEMGGVL